MPTVKGSESIEHRGLEVIKKTEQAEMYKEVPVEREVSELDVWGSTAEVVHGVEDQVILLSELILCYVLVFILVGWLIYFWISIWLLMIINDN